MTERDPVFCAACGTVHESATQQIAELQDAVTQLGIEVARKQGRISRLRKEQANGDPVLVGQAMEVARYWKQVCRPAPQLEGRIPKVMERLQSGEFDVADLQKAVWGYSCRPNMLQGKRVRKLKGGDRRDELDLICRDAAHVEEGMRIADEEVRYDQVLLNQGASKHVAGKCDCGHAQGWRALFWLHGHDACMEKECRCTSFDDANWQADAWLRQQGHWERVREERKRNPSRAAAPFRVEAQESLL